MITKREEIPETFYTNVPLTQYRGKATVERTMVHKAANTILPRIIWILKPGGNGDSFHASRRTCSAICLVT